MAKLMGKCTPAKEGGEEVRGHWVVLFPPRDSAETTSILLPRNWLYAFTVDFLPYRQGWRIRVAGQVPGLEPDHRPC